VNILVERVKLWIVGLDGLLTKLSGRALSSGDRQSKVIVFRFCRRQFRLFGASHLNSSFSAPANLKTSSDIA
jgi:hypothetical protein